MTREEREEAIEYIKCYRKLDEDLHNITPKGTIAFFATEKCLKHWDMAIKALEAEPLTDTEQRIFLASMSREEKVCKEVCADGDGVDLVAVCHSIERKVKRALWI